MSIMKESARDELTDRTDFLDHSSSKEMVYELMPKIPIYDSNGEGSITESEQTHLGTNRESECSQDGSECRTRRSNQYVESVKYSGYNGDSDSYSSDDETNGLSSHAEGCPKANCLCKICCSNYLGDDFNSICTKHVHPFFKQACPCEAPSPVPLLHLYCQRCENNCNIDIDIILIYVNSVLDQLKRITDGEYLTKEVKNRWMAVKLEDKFCDFQDDASTESEIISDNEILEKDWCNYSHDNELGPEMDIRYLFEYEKCTKEAPRMLTDSEESKTTDMRIECRAKIQSAVTHHNFTFQFDQSIFECLFWSIGTFKTPEERNILFIGDDTTTNSMLPLRLTADSYNLQYTKSLEPSQQHPVTRFAKIVEIIEVSSDSNICMELCNSDKEIIPFHKISPNPSNVTVHLVDVLSQMPKSAVNVKQCPFNPMSVDELKVSIQNLDIQPSLEEESDDAQEIISKQKPVAVKSPYDTQTQAVEDKRRKRLLEIRENRAIEKRMKLHEKHSGEGRNVKSHVTASNSVTKLSISNKSFYNSIFGNAGKIINNKKFNIKMNGKIQKRSKSIKETLKQKSKERVVPQSLSPKPIQTPCNEIQYIKDLIEYNGPLDRTRTKILKPADSMMSIESSNSFNMNAVNVNFTTATKQSVENLVNNDEMQECSSVLHNTKSLHHLLKNYERTFRSKLINNISGTKISTVDSKMLDPIEETDRVSEKKYPSRVQLECRESIDKIYNLMRKIGTTDKVALKNTKTKFTESSTHQQMSRVCELSAQGSESGNSSKQNSDTSFKSSPSAEKLNKTRVRKLLQSNCIEEPKVIIRSKFPKNAKKLNLEIFPKDSKKINIPAITKHLPPSPLPMITKVLNEVSNIQKNKLTKQELRHPKFISPNIKGSPKNSPQVDRYFVERNEKIKNKTQQIREKIMKPTYKLPDNVIEKHKVQYKANYEVTDEEKEARGEAIRGPTMSRLDALAQPRQSYIRAHNEHIANKYGRTVMTDRLQRLVQAPHQLHSPQSMYQQYGKPKSGYLNENKHNFIRDPVTERYKFQRSSTFSETRTSTSTMKEGIPHKKDNNGINSSSKENSTCIFGNGYDQWRPNQARSPRKKQDEKQDVKTWIPLIPKTSEHYELEQEDALKTLLEKLVNSERFKKDTLNENRHDAESSAAKGDSAVSKNMESVLPIQSGVAKVKNGRVIIEPEDLIDSDFIPFFESPMEKERHNETPLSNNEIKPNAVTTLEKVATSNLVESLNVNGKKHNVIFSNMSMTLIPSKNMFILQAGDTSRTAMAFQSTSVQEFFNKNCLTIKSFAKLQDVLSLSNKNSVWDVQQIPNQISAVYYSFPKLSHPKAMYESKVYHIARIIDYNMVQKATEYMVCSTVEQSEIGLPNNEQKQIISCKSSPTKGDNNADTKSISATAIKKKDNEQNQGVEVQLESTSSLDVLFKLLNEIHSISMGTMQVASVYGFQMVEIVPPLQYATSHNIMSTTEMAIFGQVFDIKNIECMPSNTLKTKYKDSLITADLPAKQVAIQTVSLRSPKQSTGTSVTDLNDSMNIYEKSIITFKSKFTDVGLSTEKLEDIEIKECCKLRKKHTGSEKVERRRVKSTTKESSTTIIDNLKAKKELFIYVYGVLILALFAAMSVPAMLSIQS